MFEGIILGFVQGIAEWLPVSSEGLIVLVKVNFFGVHDVEEIIKGALLLHLGTVLAAVVYLRHEFWTVIKTFFSYSSSDLEQKRIVQFLVGSTLITGVIGFAILFLIKTVEIPIESVSKYFTLLVAGLLLVTGFLQLKATRIGHKQARDLSMSDSVWIGIAQGFAALPGLSRSGLTVATFLLRDFDKTWALKLSFMMSVPVVLAGNVLLNYNFAIFTAEMWWGLLASFVFGLLTIDLLMRVARRINFGYFVLVFAALTFLAVFI